MVSSNRPIYGATIWGGVVAIVVWCALNVASYAEIRNPTCKEIEDKNAVLEGQAGIGVPLLRKLRTNFNGKLYEIPAGYFFFWTPASKLNVDQRLRVIDILFWRDNLQLVPLRMPMEVIYILDPTRMSAYI